MEFDVLIRNGTVVDGSRDALARASDVGIVGDHIAAVDRLDGATGAVEIDATGKAVAPGFVDVHLHSEIELLGGPYRYGSVLQGVTTHLAGPDGFGWAPLPADLGRELWEHTLFGYGRTDLDVNWPRVDDYLALFPDQLPVNLVPQVPHLAVRMAAMGWDARPATDAELEQMKVFTREWMEAGAVAFCVGLDYAPGISADLRELVELSRVVREYGGIYATHQRYGELGKVAAWRETMEIGRQADIPVHISHESVTDETAPLLDEAARTCDLTFDWYLYLAGCTHLAMMLPNWAQAGGPEGIRQRLRDPLARPLMRDHLHRVLSGQVASGARAVFAANRTGRYIGMSVAEAAKAAGLPLGDFAMQALEDEDPYALMVFHRGGAPEQHEEQIRRSVTHPAHMVASDGIYHGEYSHPRAYGCYAQVLRKCVRETKAISLEQAVYKMSGFPAERFRLKDRGLLRPGYGADVVIFDPARVADRATWKEARLEPIGIDRVLVNGQTVVLQGQPTGQLPGRVLRPLL